MNPLFLTDAYKTSHHKMYAPGTILVYSNFTPRSLKHAPSGLDKVVVFGTQMMMRTIDKEFQKNFFLKSKHKVISEIKEAFSTFFGSKYDTTHFEKLHDLGYLPIVVKALEEGTLVDAKIPVLTIYNTDKDFYWLPNYLETIISSLLWKPMTSASIAYQYKKILRKYAEKTDKNNLSFTDFQGHDFSMRGMDSVEATISSGMGHLTSFYGTDSLPTIHGIKKYYEDTGFVAASVPATEHSVMCSGLKENELDTFKRLMETYPTGILSVVSDTWDLWNVITNILPQLKDQILSREGKLVIRPDSGDPVDIICGKLNYNFMDKEQSNLVMKAFPNESPENKGVIELLWDIFGGTVNEQGYKVLDSHIGAIYGDSITLERAEQICERLAAKGFASTNIVFGIGSFTYQHNTRDTFGFAMKATHITRVMQDPNPHVVEYPIFKDPVTDDGVKKSAKGLIKVYEEGGQIKMKDEVSWSEESEGLLKVIYDNGIFINQTTFSQIRNRINATFA